MNFNIQAIPAENINKEGCFVQKNKYVICVPYIYNIFA